MTAEPPRTAAELAALLRPGLGEDWLVAADRGVLRLQQRGQPPALLRVDGASARALTDLALQLAECRRLRAETGDGPELSEDDAARMLR